MKEQTESGNVRDRIHVANLMKMDLLYRLPVGMALRLRNQPVDHKYIFSDRFRKVKFSDDGFNIRKRAVDMMVPVTVVMTVVIAVVMAVIVTVVMAVIRFIVYMLIMDMFRFSMRVVVMTMIQSFVNVTVMVVGVPGTFVNVITADM